MENSQFTYYHHFFKRTNSVLLSQNFVQRIACHIQVFALSRWLAVMLPVEYYEFSRALQWSIPYFDLPWENGHNTAVLVGSSPFTSSSSYISKIHDSENFQSWRLEKENSNITAPVFGLPLDPMEYRFYFEVINANLSCTYLTSVSMKLKFMLGTFYHCRTTMLNQKLNIF